MSSVSRGFAPRPPPVLCPQTRWGTSVPSPPVLSPSETNFWIRPCLQRLRYTSFQLSRVPSNVFGQVQFSAVKLLYLLIFCFLRHIPSVFFTARYIFLETETGPQALPTFLLCFFVFLCYQIFKVLRLCRFSTDRYETFHTDQRQYSASSYRGGFLT